MMPPEPLVITQSPAILYVGAALFALLLIGLWTAREVLFEKYSRRVIIALCIANLAIAVFCLGVALRASFFTPPKIKFEMTAEYISCSSWPLAYQVPLNQFFHLRVDHYHRARVGRGSGYNYYVVVAYLKPSAMALSWEGRDDGGRYITCKLDGDWVADSDVDAIRRNWLHVLKLRSTMPQADKPMAFPDRAVAPSEKSLIPPGRSLVISPSGKVTYE